MANSIRSGDYYVAELLPFAQAGGYPAVFTNPTNARMTVCHYLIARDRAGNYLSAGDGPCSPQRDPWRVAPRHYVGVVKRIFTYPR